MKTWQKLKRFPSLWNTYFMRERVTKAIRTFFDHEQFHEVETPLLIAHPPAESYLEIFETTLLDRNRNRMTGYLSTSPEVSLKKLMAAGIGNCFALTKSFRNMETHGGTHNPEFTILEWYRVGANYADIMDDVEKLIRFIHKNLNETLSILRYQGEDIDIHSPWERITVSQAFTKWAGINFNEFLNDTAARTIAAEHGMNVTADTTWEQLYNQIFLNEIEPNLGHGRPTILYDFPGVMGALARKKQSDSRFAERFEFYIAGLELGDCYSELTDWREQEKRFKQELMEIKRLGKTSYEYDQDFIEALKEGLPDSSGIAVGLDRLVMLFADVKTIQETLFFPSSELFFSD